MPTSVKFWNKSLRPAKVLWLNSDGDAVEHKTVQPGHFYTHETYITLPWIANDADTGAPLLLNGNSVFFTADCTATAYITAASADN